MKPLASFTQPVSARVAPDLKQWLLDGADQHQMSLCEYTALILALAAGEHDVLNLLRRESHSQRLLLEAAEKRLADQHAAFAWYQGAVAAQLTHGRQNLECLRRLHEQYGNAPVPVAEAQKLHFAPSYLLVSLSIDGFLYHAIGEYAWRYNTSQQTHLLILHYERAVS